VLSAWITSPSVTWEESVSANKELWTRSNAEYTDARAPKAWLEEEITWGVWHVPERQVRVLPADLTGLDVVELGCGTAYVSAWLARRGARPVGVDPTRAQLDTARRCQRELGITFELVEAAAEQVPLPDSSFDLAVSEYGASIWAEPRLWLAEASRLLRPGGRLVFLRNSILSILCATDEGATRDCLVRSQFGGYRHDWRAFNGGIEFHPPHGEWIRMLRANGFQVLDLVELEPSADAVDHPYYDYVKLEWARRWPAEEIWVAEKAVAQRTGRGQHMPPGTDH
jgi:SAM-dependent methyltransferase